MKLKLKWCWNLSVEGSMLSMQSCMCWRSFSTYYCTLFFKQKLQYFKGNAQSQAALFMEYHVLKKNTTWIHRCLVLCLYTKKCWTHILNALCLLYFGSIVAAFFEKCQTLQKARWNTKLLSEHLILSKIGEKKARTKCRSHEVEGSDLD